MELTEDNEKGWKRITLTPIKEADDGTNNYTEFKQKSVLELNAAGYWKFVDGPEYSPPDIPELRTTQEIQGVDSTGATVTVSIPGNEQEVKAARERSKVWLDGDKKALAIIVKAVPVEKLYVVRDCTSAHAAWKALKNEYEPANALAALTIMQQIVGNVCHANDDPVLWLRTMIQLYGRLRDADPSMLGDGEFAKHLIMLMTRDNRWRYCRDDLRKRLRIAEAAGRPISSQTVIQRLKDEEVELGIAPSVTMINAIVAAGKGKGKYEPSAVPGAYNANTDFVGNTSSPRKPQRNDWRFKPYPNNNNSSLNDRRGRFNNSNSICENTFCIFPAGHTKSDCFVYGGGRVGQYPPNFNGPRDLHLSPDARIAAWRKLAVEKAKGRGEQGRESARYAGVAEHSANLEGDVKDVIENVEDGFAFMLELGEKAELIDVGDEVSIDEEIVVNAVALNIEIPQNDSINHDTGATWHIFREKCYFKDYTTFDTPLQVHGFGSTLSATAIWKGTIFLRAKHGSVTRTFSLSNVLHIPMARCNLISGSRIDRKGVNTRTGNGKITYYNGKGAPFATGAIVRDLYKMDVVPVNAENESSANSSTSLHQPAMIAAMVPNVTALFDSEPDSKFARRVGFTTVHQEKYIMPRQTKYI